MTLTFSLPQKHLIPHFQRKGEGKGTGRGDTSFWEKFYRRLFYGGPKGGAFYKYNTINFKKSHPYKKENKKKGRKYYML